MSGWCLLVAKEANEVAIKFAKELMDIHDITGADALTRDRAFRLDGLFVVDDVESIFREPAQRQLSLLRVAIIKDSGHEVPGMAIVAFDEHGPDIRLAGEHVDIFAVELAVTHNAAIHPSEYDVLDLAF
jgi:hypothetical protein